MQLLAPLTTGHTALSATVTLPKGSSWAPIFGQDVTVGRFREAQDQTYDGGEFVSLNSSGFVTNHQNEADPTAGALKIMDTTAARETIASLTLGMAVLPARYLTATSTDTVDVILCHGARFNVRFIDFSADVAAAAMDATSGTSEMRDVVVGKLVGLGRYAGANIAAATHDSRVGRDCQPCVNNTTDATALKNYARVTDIPDSTYGGPWPPAYYWGGVWISIESASQTFNG